VSDGRRNDDTSARKAEDDRSFQAKTLQSGGEPFAGIDSIDEHQPSVLPEVAPITGNLEVPQSGIAIVAIIRDVDTAQFVEEVIERSKTVPIVVDFWAEWCGPCKVLSPTLERMTIEHEGKFELVKIDVDQNQQLAAQFGVQGIPTVVSFKDGKPVSQFTGALPEDQIRQWLETILPSAADEAVTHAHELLDAGKDGEAEAALRAVLDMSPGHDDASMSLAVLLIDSGRTEEALEVLDKLPPSTEVDNLRAAARLGSAVEHDSLELEHRLAQNPDDHEAKIALAQRQAAEGQFEPALSSLLELVEGRGDHADDARQAMVDIFGVLGNESPITAEYRKRLAAALF